jgi:plasmid stabilization system protein ParE
MTLQVNYLPDAVRDFNDSVDWYAEHSVVVARRFVTAIDAAIDRITQDPHNLPYVDERHQECPVKRFPFRIVYRHDPVSRP